MPAEVLFIGGRRESVALITGSPVDTTTSTRYDTNYADASLYLNTNDVVQHSLFSQSSNVLSATTVVSGETIYVHFDFVHNSGASTRTTINLVELRDSSGFPWLGIRGASGNGGYRFVYNSGTGASPVWTLIGANFTLTAGVRYTLDVALTIGATHSAALYQDGSLIQNGTFSQASLTNIAAVRYSSVADSGTSNNNTHLSQLMATRDISTIGAKVKYSRATGAGANTGWSNSHTSVNEVVGSDLTVQSAASAGLKSTHAMGDVTVATGFEIKSVFHWLRAKNDGSAPTNIKSVLRQSAVDYSTGNLSGIGVGFGPIGARYDTDPSGSPWTATSWNAIEAGYEAAA